MLKDASQVSIQAVITIVMPKILNRLLNMKVFNSTSLQGCMGFELKHGKRFSASQLQCCDLVLPNTVVKSQGEKKKGDCFSHLVMQICEEIADVKCELKLA